MADTTESKRLGKRPETDDALQQQQQQATPATGGVIQMEHVNNQPATVSATTATTGSPSHAQNNKEGEPSIPTVTGAVPVTLQDVMDETDPVSPPESQPQAVNDPDSISQASQSASGPNSTEAPVCNITLLLPTGARHPYKIDEKYLSKRGVDIPETVAGTGQPDPFSISVYKVKELILREWREEWEGKPASPTSIRLIHFGKLLDDKESLKKYKFSPDTPNVVHMSVRPAEMMEEDGEGAKGGKTAGGREGSRREGGGGCCVIL